MRPICSIDGCNRQIHGRGWCKAHYLRWMRHGAPLAGGTSPGEPLAWLTTHTPHQGDDCLKWPYATHPDGRPGQIMFDGLPVYAYRVMCILAHGQPPTTGLDVAHSCGKGHEGCVNPRHLRWATRSENVADRTTHGTDNRGSRCAASKLSEADVRQIRLMLGTAKQRDIAKAFGVDETTIGDIKAGRTWAWMKEGEAIIRQFSAKSEDQSNA